MIFMHMSGPDLVGLIPAALMLVLTGVVVGVASVADRKRKVNK